MRVCVCVCVCVTVGGRGIRPSLKWISTTTYTVTQWCHNAVTVCVSAPPPTRRGVSMVLQRCYRGFTELLPWCHGDVSVVSQKFHRADTEVLKRCDSGVTVVLPPTRAPWPDGWWRGKRSHSWGPHRAYPKTVVSQWCHNGVTVVLLWCYSGVTVVLPWCHSGVTVVLPWCYRGVTVVLQWCLP
jgi:hypothetical protein